MSFKPCVVIPFYNHKNTIEKTVADLLALNLFCIIIDDGSDQQTQDILKTLVDSQPSCCSHRLETNQGKGAAVIKGLAVANEMGFTHALQVDADGQHNLNDIPAFFSKAKSNTDALICGQPVFDGSIPKVRKFSRGITHFWVGVETLTFHPIDSMCGFRVYPVASINVIINHYNVGKRMDFDTDILVKSIWSGVPIKLLSTNVIYPEDGVSHFHYWQDNLLMIKMHIKLVFGMIFRLPRYIFNQFNFSSKHV